MPLGVLRDVGEIAGVEEEPNQVGVTVIEINVRVDARLKVVEETFVGAGQAVVISTTLDQHLVIARSVATRQSTELPRRASRTC